MVVAAALAAVAAGCGGSAKNSSGTATRSVASGGTKLSVGLVTDIGGLNDRSFNHLAYVGLQRAQRTLGVEGRVLTSSSAADYVSNLSSLAEQGDQLVIGVGLLMADALAQVYDAIRNAQKNSYGSGSDLVFDARNGGVGIGAISPPVPKPLVARARALERTLAAGKGSSIPETVR